MRPNEFAKGLLRNPAPSLFETIPPLKKTSPDVVDKRAREVYERLRSLPRKHPINVPDIVEEQHGGRPQHRRIDPNVYALLIANQLEVEAIVNKGVVYFKSAQETRDWIRATLKSGIRNIVMVGGTARHIVYPGPPVNDAIRLALPEIEEREGVVGSILLQVRKDEAQRMFYKTLAGARFFTSQMLFDSSTIIQVLSHYYKICNEFDTRPATIFLSFAPTINKEDDYDFTEGLGAAFPESAERYIYDSGPPSKTGERSIRHGLRVYTEIRTSLEATGVLLNLGLNVEQLRGELMPPAINMLKELDEAAHLPTAELKREIA